jgi:hypothetical protein
VTEHDDFDGQFFSVIAAQPEQLEQSNDGRIEEGERQGPSLPTA